MLVCIYTEQIESLSLLQAYETIRISCSQLIGLWSVEDGKDSEILMKVSEILWALCGSKATPRAVVKSLKYKGSCSIICEKGEEIQERGESEKQELTSRRLGR